MYQAVENLVDHNLSENLYKNLIMVCERHTREQLVKLLEEASSMSPQGFLDTMNKYWSRHCQEMVSTQYALILIAVSSSFGASFCI